MKTFYIWVLLTVATLLIFVAGGFLFENAYKLNYIEASFIAFMILWCEQVDERKLK